MSASVILEIIGFCVYVPVITSFWKLHTNLRRNNNYTYIFKTICNISIMFNLNFKDTSYTLNILKYAWLFYNLTVF